MQCRQASGDQRKVVELALTAARICRAAEGAADSPEGQIKDAWKVGAQHPGRSNHFLDPGILRHKTETSQHPADLHVCRAIDGLVIGHWYMETAHKDVRPSRRSLRDLDPEVIQNSGRLIHFSGTRRRGSSPDTRAT